jgi:hypothetical protein
MERLNPIPEPSWTDAIFSLFKCDCQPNTLGGQHIVQSGTRGTELVDPESANHLRNMMDPRRPSPGEVLKSRYEIARTESAKRSQEQSKAPSGYEPKFVSQLEDIAYSVEQRHPGTLEEENLQLQAEVIKGDAKNSQNLEPRVACCGLFKSRSAKARA